MIGNAIKEQAISSGTNLIADVVRGDDLKESLHKEGRIIRKRAGDTIENLTSKKRKKRCSKRKTYGNRYADENTDWLSD